MAEGTGTEKGPHSELRGGFSRTSSACPDPEPAWRVAHTPSEKEKVIRTDRPDRGGLPVTLVVTAVTAASAETIVGGLAGAAAPVSVDLQIRAASDAVVDSCTTSDPDAVGAYLGVGDVLGLDSGYY
jgi:hypothetical protein